MLQRREAWLFELIHKILNANANAEQPWLALLDTSSADLLSSTQMKYAKVDMFRYRMADPLWTITMKWLRGEEVIWWNREFEESLIRPVQMYDGKLAYARL